MMRNTIIFLCITTLLLSACKQTRKNSETEPNNNSLVNKEQNSDESIEGRYKNSEDSACELLLDIIKSENGYSYKFLVKDKFYEGNITISVSENEKYIILEGIPWIENKGSIDEGVDFDEVENIPTYGISFLFEGNGMMMMQNYGNALNYYVKLDCDEKYIQLIKD